MGAAVEIWLKSLIDTFTWGWPHSAMGQCEQEKGEYFSFVFPLPVQEDGKARGVEDDKCKKNDRSAFVSFPDARSLPAGDEPTKMEVLLSIR